MPVGSERSLSRIAAAIVVWGAVVYLGVRLVGSAVFSGNQQGVENAQVDVNKPPRPGATQEVVVRGIDTQRAEVVVDGVNFFSGVLKGGETLRPPVGRRIEVALADLTRAVVIYNGSRVGPLGKLNAGRRLIFIDDAN